MAGEVEIKMNSADLTKQLRAFRENVAIKAVKNSTRRIAAELLRELRAAVPRLTGNLARNLGIRAKYVFERGVVAAKVVVNTRGKKGDPKNAYYWRFVEFDHKTRPRKLAGKWSRQTADGKPAPLRYRSIDRTAQRTVPGKGFIRQTFERIQPRIQSMFYADLQKAIDRAKQRAN